MKKGEIYHFDEVYSCCPYSISDERVCNGGYVCTSIDNDEVCECDPTISKCYDFSCPFVTATPSLENVKSSREHDVEDFDFDDEGFVMDYHEMVIFNGFDGSRAITHKDVINNQQVNNYIYSIIGKKRLGKALSKIKKRYTEYMPTRIGYNRYKNKKKFSKKRSR